MDIYPTVDDLFHGVLRIFLLDTLAESHVGRRRRREAAIHHALLFASIAPVAVGPIRCPVCRRCVRGSVSKGGDVG